MMKFGKYTGVALMAVALMMLALSGCGAKTMSQKGENIVPMTQETPEGQERNFEVKLDERDESTQYEYGTDDLSLVDTVSGKKIMLGMTEAEIQEITGEPQKTDIEYKIYDGVVVKYSEGIAVSFIVSNGQFKDGKATRYFTSRGVGVGTSTDNFMKAYGDSYNKGEETVDEESGEVTRDASRAVRYFEKDGSKIKFLGTELSEEQKEGDTTNYYMQDFMFSNVSDSIATMRISLMSAVQGGK